ncbi:MAG: hypothetical protein ACFFFY_01670 [Promethearchaeota archaeon]
MSNRSLMNKQKLIVDDIISVILIVILFSLALFLRLLAIMSIAVYSLFCLQLYGLYKIYWSIVSRKIKVIFRVLGIALGIACIYFPSYILNYMFTKPHIGPSYIIYFLSIPIFLIGLAGFLKGLIINVYSPLLRLLNSLIGATTVIFTLFAIIFAETGFVFHLFTLLTTLTLNGIFRAALYLSEYGLSLTSFKNLKLVWFIMDSPPVLSQEENLFYM